MERIIKIFGKKDKDEKDDDFYNDLEQKTQDLDGDSDFEKDIEKGIKGKETVIRTENLYNIANGDSEGNGNLGKELQEDLTQLETKFLSRESEIKEIRSDITEIKDNIRNLLHLYEMVSGMYNPFTEPQNPASHAPKTKTSFMPRERIPVKPPEDPPARPKPVKSVEPKIRPEVKRVREHPKSDLISDLEADLKKAENVQADTDDAPTRDTSLFLKLRLIEFSLEDMFFQKIRGVELKNEELRQTDRYMAEFRRELGGTNGV
jgi:hypothetical protein